MFKKEWFNFHIIVDFLFLLLFISGFISWKSEKILGVMAVLLNLLRLVLWPNMACPGECCIVLEKNVCAAVAGQSVIP